MAYFSGDRANRACGLIAPATKSIYACNRPGVLGVEDGNEKRGKGR